MSSAESAHGLVSFKVITWYSMTKQTMNTAPDVVFSSQEF